MGEFLSSSSPTRSSFLGSEALSVVSSPREEDSTLRLSEEGRHPHPEFMKLSQPRLLRPSPNPELPQRGNCTPWSGSFSLLGAETTSYTQLTAQLVQCWSFCTKETARAIGHMTGGGREALMVDSVQYEGEGQSLPNGHHTCAFWFVWRRCRLSRRQIPGGS